MARPLKGDGLIWRPTKGWCARVTLGIGDRGKVRRVVQLGTRDREIARRLRQDLLKSKPVTTGATYASTYVKDDLYVIEAAAVGLVKIGRTVNVERRIACLRSASPVSLAVLHVLRGCGDSERLVHLRYAKLREHGEWFRREGALHEWCSRIEEYRKGR